MNEELRNAPGADDVVTHMFSGGSVRVGTNAGAWFVAFDDGIAWHRIGFPNSETALKLGAALARFRRRRIKPQEESEETPMSDDHNTKPPNNADNAPVCQRCSDPDDLKWARELQAWLCPGCLWEHRQQMIGDLTMTDTNAHPDNATVCQRCGSTDDPRKALWVSMFVSSYYKGSVGISGRAATAANVADAALVEYDARFGEGS